MTREEEIQKTAKIFHASSDDYTVYKKGFETGAEWADQHQRKGLWDSEKVCEWIGNHLLTSSQGSVLEDLRKAMEGINYDSRRY